MRLTRAGLIIGVLLQAFHLSSQTRADSLESSFNTETDVGKKASAAAYLTYEIYKSRADLSKSLYYFNYAESHIDKITDPQAKVQVYSQRGIVLYYQDKTDSARIYFEKARELGRKYKLHNIECAMLNNLGSVYYSRAEYQKALSYYTEGIQKELEYGFPEGSKISMNNIGYIYVSLEAFRKSRTYFWKSLLRCQRDNDQASMTSAYDGLGASYEGEKNYDSAIFYHNKSYINSMKVHDLGDKMLAAYSLAKLYNFTGRNDSALKYLAEARLLSQKTNNKTILGICYACYHQVYSDLHKEELAQKYVDSALFTAAYIEDIALLKDFYKMKAENEYKKHNADTAYVYLRKFMDIRDSLYKAEVSKSIAELQAKFDLSQKEKQIVLLNEKDKQKQLVIYFTLAAGILILSIAAYIYKVSRQRKKLNALLEAKNAEVLSQKVLLEEKQKEIIDSIHYAKRIQKSLITSEKYIEKNISKLKSEKS